LKNRFCIFFLLFLTLSFYFVVPSSFSFADDQSFTVDKTAYTNTASIIKDARAHAAAGKNEEALAIYQYADQVVDPENEPILKHKITVEMENIKTLIAQELQREKDKKIADQIAQGMADFSANKFNVAIKDFEDVLVLDPNNAQAQNYINNVIPQKLESQQFKEINDLYVVARTYYKEDFLEEADKVFKKILDLDLDQAEAQNYVDNLIPQALKDKPRRDKLKADREKRFAALQAKMLAQITQENQTREDLDHQDAQRQALAGWEKQKSKLVQVPAPNSTETKVMVHEIDFSGNSIFNDKALKPIVAPYLNKELSLSDLKVIAGFVAQYYHNGGYFLAQVIIPQQDIDAQNGVVNFTVLEGRLGKIIVTGNKRFSTKRVLDALSKVFPGDALRKQNLQHGLLVLNSDSGIKTSSVLQAGNEVGTTDVNVKVTEDNRIKGSLSFDNTGVASTGRYHVSPELIFPNITGRGDVLDFKWINALDARDAYYYGLNYMTPVGSKGFQLKGEYVKSTFAVGQQYAELGIKSNSTTYGFGGYYPYILNPNLTMSAEMWYEAKDFDQTYFSGAIKLIDDRIRKLRIEPINIDEQDLTGRTLASLGIHQGLGEDFKGMTNDSILSSRSYAMADDNFTKFVPSLARVQSINNRLTVVSRVSGQYSHAPLVAGEEWAIGGMDSVHGFESGQYLGDDGLSANLETSYTLFSTLKTKYSFLLFADHGSVWLMKPTVGEKEFYNISGSGVGLDANIYDVDARLDWGYPIGPTDGGGSTIYFQIKYSF